MLKVWKLAATKTFKEFVIMVTGKKLSADAWMKNSLTKNLVILKKAKARAKRLSKIPMQKGPIELGAKISLVSGKKTIATNTKSFEDMVLKYKKWLLIQKV